MRNKGQIDIFGLVIIIVLLTVIALFSLFFISGGENDTTDIYFSLKAQNFANALAKSSVDNTNMEALVSSCCSGISGSCDVALDFAKEEFKKLSFPGDNKVEDLVKFELSCKYDSTPYFVGKCEEGVTSESTILQTGDSIRIILCR